MTSFVLLAILSFGNSGQKTAMSLNSSMTGDEGLVIARRARWEILAILFSLASALLVHTFLDNTFFSFLLWTKAVDNYLEQGGRAGEFLQQARANLQWTLIQSGQPFCDRECMRLQRGIKER